MKSNFEENIKINQGNKINSYFLIHPPPISTIDLNSPRTQLHEACMVSPEIPSQQVLNNILYKFSKTYGFQMENDKSGVNALNKQ